ncbi:MAG TPA: DUF1996 domain-containing protein [Albitalea sp.]|uniref:DUF1996 domain-containing protein n=1 Tax=Piscinibacter sp. TaxID=1903157 RepID=UPI002ED1A633
MAALVAVTAARAQSAPAPDDDPHAAHAHHGRPVDRQSLPPPARGASVERIKPTQEQAVHSSHGEFRTICLFSHMAFDDPMVFPRQPGASHLHAFFGNTGTNAFSTASSIAGSGDSTCLGGIANRTAYWVPATIDTRTNKPVTPVSAVIYYKNGYDGVRADQVQPFPQGLRMISGNPMNTSTQGPYRFVCIGQGVDQREHREMPDCPVGSELIQMVFFPQCWDGKRLDSPDHKSHMSRPVNKACPATHPVALPQITFNIHYRITEPGQATHWRLASDTYPDDIPAGRSMHGDWFDGWKPSVKEAWTQGCNQGARDCKAYLLGDGRVLY